MTQTLLTTPNGAGCRCGSHRQHRVLRFAWENPSASRIEAAKALKMSEGNVRAAFHLLRRKDLTRICPECFSPRLLGGVCQNCGYEPDAPALPIEVRADEQSPTNHLHPGNLLGSVTDYSAVGFTNQAFVMERKVREETFEEPVLAGILSDVMEALKSCYPEEAISDEAGRLARKEVLEFRARYPGLNPKGLRAQLTRNVLARLRLLHPQLRKVRRLEA